MAMERFNPARPHFSPYGFTCVRWQAERMIKANCHNEIELNYLPSGSLLYMHGGKKVQLTAGRLTVFWAALPHQVLDFQDLRGYFVSTIPLVWFLERGLPIAMTQHLLRGEMLSDLPPANTRQRAIDRRLDIAAFHRWTEDFAAGVSARLKAAQLEIHGRLERFALDYTTQVANLSPCGAINQAELSKAEQMAAFIALEYANPISVADISRAVGLHQSHAMSIFSKTFGLSMMEFVRQHRIARSQSLLVGTDEPIVKVAFAAGFQSISQFYAIFKQHCHCSPRDYRLHHRE